MNSRKLELKGTENIKYLKSFFKKVQDLHPKHCRTDKGNFKSLRKQRTSKYIMIVHYIT